MVGVGCALLQVGKASDDIQRHGGGLADLEVVA